MTDEKRGKGEAVGVRPSLLRGEKLPREPQQRRSIERRTRLKEAALALFGEKGYEGTSVGEIARRARLPVGSFYQHYRTKKQLLVALMDELLERLSEVRIQPSGGGDVRCGLRDVLRAAFSRDLRYLGAYRAWQEAVLTNPELARKQDEIHAWTTARVRAVFERLRQLPGARAGVDVEALARVMDSFFWSLLGRAVLMKQAELDEWIESSTHLIYHAIFTDASEKERKK
jgi:AcrR family transcriptional regulator